MVHQERLNMAPYDIVAVRVGAEGIRRRLLDGFRG